MNFKGTIVSIGEIKSGLSKAGKEWKSLEFVVEEEKEQFPQSGVFKLMKSGEHVSHVDNFNTYNKVGDQVDVEFNLKCNKWKDSYFQELSVWKVNKLSASQGVKVQDAVVLAQVEEDSDSPF